MNSDDLLVGVLRAAGALHLAQLPAMRLLSGMLGWQRDLHKLSALNRRMVQVMAVAIVLVMSGLGLVVVASAHQLAQPGTWSAAFTIFLTVFLAFRASVQRWIYAPLWPGHGRARAIHWGLSAMFTFQTLVYGCAAIHALQAGGAMP